MLSGDPAGVSKHPPNRNGGGFADARLGLDTYPPSRDSAANPTRFRKAIDAYRPDHPREENIGKRVIERKLGSCQQLGTAPLLLARIELRMKPHVWHT